MKSCPWTCPRKLLSLELLARLHLAMALHDDSELDRRWRPQDWLHQQLLSWRGSALTAPSGHFHSFSAASVQLSMDKAANAVGGAISEYQLKHHKLGRRVKGLQGCVLKYMSNRSVTEQPQDPCFFDTGAGIASHSRLGRGLLQDGDINSIPNYAAPAGATRSPAAGISASPSTNQNPFTSSASPKPAATNQNQNPFAVSSASPAQGAVSTAASNADDVSGATTVNGGGGVIRDQEKGNSTGLPPPLPQPIGPDPLQWQQTEDFPEGTRLTLDQADLLLSGRGFH